ncbi:uncharacterized protein LOC119987944 [Tripterygium wilfordii]|uniref:uncharacterized protein LOC119987944 n=1 Tax=Tripterygium wilfordii TaxID=458696 RepID=UPI0018F819E2|nr:uncharacterized protein LOC119987944 [Tripterygium wilfordii]
MADNIKVDDRCEFETDMVFKSRQSLIDWVQQTGCKLGYIIVIYRSNIGGLGKKHRLQFKCDRGGNYQSKKPSLKQKFQVTRHIDGVEKARSKQREHHQNYIQCTKKHKTAERSGQSQMQSVFSFLNDHEYFFDYRANHTTNELEDLFFAHPGSLDRLRAFPNVLLMDATYQTNRYGLPLVEIVGVTSTSRLFA